MKMSGESRDCKDVVGAYGIEERQLAVVWWRASTPGLAVAAAGGGEEALGISDQGLHVDLSQVVAGYRQVDKS